MNIKKYCFGFLMVLYLTTSIYAQKDSIQQQESQAYSEQDLKLQAKKWTEIFWRAEHDEDRLDELQLPQKEKEKLAEVLRERKLYALAKIQELKEAGFTYEFDDNDLWQWFELNVVVGSFIVGGLLLCSYLLQPAARVENAVTN
ncbi:MAG: hypothetical protein V1855_01685 [bacterium]